MKPVEPVRPAAAPQGTRPRGDARGHADASQGASRFDAAMARAREGRPDEAAAKPRRLGDEVPGGQDGAPQDGAVRPAASPPPQGLPLSVEARADGAPAPHAARTHGASVGAGLLPGAAGEVAAQALRAQSSLPHGFVLAFPPDAWPLLRAEGQRRAGVLSLRLVAADAGDGARARRAADALRAALEASGETVGAITVVTENDA